MENDFQEVMNDYYDELINVAVKNEILYGIFNNLDEETIFNNIENKINEV